MNFKSSRVYVFGSAVDMRMGYDGLYGLVRGEFDILSGALFLFISRNRKRAKCLFWDGNGLNIWQKRMERGRFADVLNRSAISLNELKLFFEGSKEVVKRLSPRDISREFTQ